MNADLSVAMDAALHSIYETGGRPALLSELKARGLALRERQTIATNFARHLRKTATSPVRRRQPAKGCLAIVAEAGLCNKLRVILSYLQAAQDVGRHLLVVWRLGDFCPEEFDMLFEPIDGMTVLSGEAVSRALEPALLRMQLPIGALPGDFHTHPAVVATEREVSMFAPLRPRPPLAVRIDEMRAKCGASYVAVHVRRTDFEALFGEKTSDSAFDAWLRHHMADSTSACTSVYVATDNESTQRHFAKLCGDRFRAVAPIVAHATTLRHTSVADAVVDLFVCAGATAFMGTRGSSFSDTIWCLRRLNGLARPDEHGFDRPVGARARRSEVENALHIEPPLPEALLELMGAPISPREEAGAETDALRREAAGRPVAPVDEHCPL